MFIERVWWYRNFQCSVIFGEIGHRCGYVAVPKETLIPMVGDDNWQYCDLDCHGGVTLDCSPKRTMGARREFCGIMIGDGMRVLGFDCGHAWDAPDMQALNRRGMQQGYHFEFLLANGGVICTQRFCEDECRKMVDHIIANIQDTIVDDIITEILAKETA